MASWARLGFAVWGLAFLAFAWAANHYDHGGLAVAGFALGGAGLFLTAGSSMDENPARWTVGVLLALVGILPFFAEVFLPLGNPDGYYAAGALYLAGLAMLVVAGAVTARAPASEKAIQWLRWGAVSAALAGLIWIPLDIATGEHAWTAGNVLEFVGAALVAAFATR